MRGLKVRPEILPEEESIELHFRRPVPVRPLGLRSRRYNLLGRKPRGYLLSGKQQNVIVKVSSPVHARYGDRKKALGKLLWYLQRDGTGEQKKGAELFTDEGIVERSAARQTVLAWADDRHHFRVIVSPEHGSLIDLPGHASALVARMEEELGTKLEWFGAAHYNTGSPHIHLAIRGKRSDGEDLVMRREFISRGIRSISQELVTRELGPRTTKERLASDLAMPTSERLTAIDVQLLAQAALDPNGNLVDLTAIPPPNSFEIELRSVKIHRLRFLRKLGLADEVRTNVWRLASDVRTRLQAMSRQDDIGRLSGTLAREMGLDVPILPYNKDAPSMAELYGIVRKRVIDEATLTLRGLVLEGIDGRFHFVSQGGTSEVAERPAREGSLVVVESKEGKRAPENEGRDSRRFVSTTVLCPFGLERSILAEGPSFLDRPSTTVEGSYGETSNVGRLLSSARRARSDELSRRASAAGTTLREVRESLEAKQRKFLVDKFGKGRKVVFGLAGKRFSGALERVVNTDSALYSLVAQSGVLAITETPRGPWGIQVGESVSVVPVGSESRIYRAVPVSEKESYVRTK